MTLSATRKITQSWPFLWVRECFGVPSLLICIVGHDATLMPFLAALQRDNWNKTWTPYAGAFVLELYKTTNGHAVRALYKGKPIKIPDCKHCKLRLHSIQGFHVFIAVNVALCDVKTFLRSLDYARSPRTCTEPTTGILASSSQHLFWYRYFAPFILAIIIVFSAMLVFRSRNQPRSSEQETLLSPS